MRELELGAAWSRVAGDAIARQSLRLRLARGLFEVVLVDRSWARTVHELAGEIGSRFGAEPVLSRARKLRLVVDDETCFECSIESPSSSDPVEPQPAAAPVRKRSRRVAVSTERENADALDRRLRQAAERMLERRPQKP